MHRKSASHERVYALQNFIICVMDAQYKKDGTTRFDRFVISINLVFTLVFAVELGINMFSNWFLKFARSGWSWLDLFVVVMSFMDFGPFNIPDWLVRLMRAFRIVRLFGRVHELTKMFSAITASLFPMMNAFVILVIVLSICECAGIPHSLRASPSTPFVCSRNLRSQMPSLGCRSLPAKPPISSASSIERLSRSSESQQAKPGSIRWRCSGPTATSSGGRLSSSAVLSSSVFGWCCR